MRNPTIYKQSELGMLPVDWREASLRELGQPKIGLTYRPSDVRERGTLVLRSSNVQDGRLCFEDNIFVDPEVAASAHVEHGDILICVRNGSRALIGKCAQIDEQAAGMAFGAFMSVYRSEYSDFVFRQFQSDGMKRQIEQHLGATINQITNASLNSFKIPFTDDPEERDAIASVLKDIDDLISSLDALIAKKRDIKQAAMQQLLTGKTRLVGSKGEWVSSTVGQVCDVKTGPFGAQLHESDYVNDGTPIITVEHLGEFGVQIDENVPLVSDADRRRLQNYSLRQGDIVFSRVGSVDRNALISFKEDGWLFSGRLLRLRPEKNISSAFLSQLFHSSPFKELVRSVAVGQTMPSLNTKIVKALPILLPPKPEQDAIAQVFADIDGDLAVSEIRIAKAKGLKQGMMQQLLTGRIRLV